MEILSYGVQIRSSPPCEGRSATCLLRVCVLSPACVKLRRLCFFLRRGVIVEERDFRDAATRALGRVATDEHAEEVLNQLIQFREVVKPFLSSPAPLLTMFVLPIAAIRVLQRDSGLPVDCTLMLDLGWRRWLQP